MKRKGQKLVYLVCTIPQARQLQFYIDSTDGYYGNQKQFRAREDRLIECLNLGIDRATDNETGSES